MSVKPQDSEGSLVENEKWCRLAYCIVVHVKKALVGILHNSIHHKDIKPLPSDPSLLYNEMLNRKGKLRNLRQDELLLLIPNNKKTFSDTFDVSMLRFLIRTFCNIKNEDGNWNKPRDADHSIAAAVFRASSIRNEVLHHGDPESIQDEEFETKWAKIEEILADLQYTGDISDMKNGAFDASRVKDSHSNMAEEFVEHLRSYKKGCTNEPFQDDYMKRRFYDDGNRNDIAIESDTNGSDSSSKTDVERKSREHDESNIVIESDFESDTNESDSSSKTDVERKSREHDKSNIVIESDFESDTNESDSSSKTDVERKSREHDKSNIVIESDFESDTNESDSSSKTDVERKSREHNESNIVIESDLENIILNNCCVMIYAEAGMGKSSMARHIKKELCNENILKDFVFLFFDSKKMNKRLRVRSHAAPLYFSQLGDYLKKNGRTEDDLSIYSCVKTTIEKLVILIDGVDEFPVTELCTGNYVDELERKVKDNEEITGTETINAIYFGFLFPYSKVVLLGRIGAFDSLKKVKVNRDAAIFNRTTKNLELLNFNDVDVEKFTCLKICKQPSQNTICNGACKEIYKKIKKIRLCKNPTDLNSLIELHKRHPSKNIGNITRTKLIIATLFNRLTNHIKQKNNFTIKTFREMSHQNDFSEYLQCIRTLGEVSFQSLLKDNVTVQVNEIRDSNVYFEDENQIKIERQIFEELDLFYVRDLDYYFILEPHHTLNIEFLSACYLFLYPDKWDSILELNQDRQLVIISFIAGLHADDYFSRDFVANVLDTSNYSLEQFFSWLYNVEDVRDSSGYIVGGHYCWFGLMETQKHSPSFTLLDSISHEVEIPQTFIPTKTIVCYIDLYLFEWYDMKSFKHSFLTKLSDKLNIESFLIKFPSFEFIIKGDIEIYNNDEFVLLDKYSANNLITFKINELSIFFLDTCFSSNLNLNTLFISHWCDSSSMINILLNGLSLSPTNTSSPNIPTIKCKRLYLKYIIQHFDFQQTEKLLKLGLSGVVDYIALDSSNWTLTQFNFFPKQIAILEDLELSTNKLLNIELSGGGFNQMFDLPNLGNRHISLCSCHVTNKDIIKLRDYISTGHSNNLTNFKIINSYVPFVRKENYSQDCEHAMYLHLYNVDFNEVSPDVFAKTFSLIPSLSFEDDYCDQIPSSHWLRLSQTERCQINEMRIWEPCSKNLEHFINIQTKMIQFISCRKDDLKPLLDYIASNQNIKLLDKEMKIFVVKFDQYDWDYYDEIIVFSGKTIEEYRNNYSLIDSLLDNIRVSFHEGLKHLNRWCCEISSPENSSPCIESSCVNNDSFVEGNEITVINEPEIKDNRIVNQDDSNCCFLRKCCCCL